MKCPVLESDLKLNPRYRPSHSRMLKTFLQIYILQLAPVSFKDRVKAPVWKEIAFWSNEDPHSSLDQAICMFLTGCFRAPIFSEWGEKNLVRQNSWNKTLQKQLVVIKDCQSIKQEHTKYICEKHTYRYPTIYVVTCSSPAWNPDLNTWLGKYCCWDTQAGE